MRAAARLPGDWKKASLFLLRNHQLLTVVLVLGTMLGLGAGSGEWLFFRAAYILLGLIILSYVWGRANVWGLGVEVQRSGDRLQVGQPIETRVRCRNTLWYPRLWLEVEDPSDMPGRPAKTIFSLAAGGLRNWRLSTPCLRRGLYTVGPLRITSGDPFGLFRFRNRYGRSQEVLVYPRHRSCPSSGRHRPTCPARGESGGAHIT